MQQHKHYPALDYLRIVLASIVMFGHDKIIAWPYAGKLSVDVFFALSGWLIGGILVNQAPQDLPRFFFNRAIRVWIPYYMALALMLAASAIKDPIDGFWLEFVLYKLTFVYNLFGTPMLAQHIQDMPLNGTANHLWSVNAEEQFYLIAPLIICFSRYGRSIILWLALSLAALAFNIYPAIVLGVTAAILAKQYPDFHLQRRARLILSACVAGSALQLLTGGYGPSAHLFAISLVLLLTRPGPKDNMGEFLGGISYQLYLNHWIGVFVFNAALKPLGLNDSPLRQLLACLLNYAIAACIYKIIDRRLRAKRDQWYAPSKAITITSLAYTLPLLGTAIAMSK